MQSAPCTRDSQPWVGSPVRICGGLHPHVRNSGIQGADCVFIEGKPTHV